MQDSLVTMSAIPAEWYGLFAVTVVLGGALVGTRQRLRQMRTSYERELEHLRYEMKALLNSAEGMGEKIKRLEQRSKVLEERQDQFTLKEPSRQTYEHAIRLVRQGEDIDKVVEQSGLSRGEVELLQTIKRTEAENAQGVRIAS